MAGYGGPQGGGQGPPQGQQGRLKHSNLLYPNLHPQPSLALS